MASLRRNSEMTGLVVGLGLALVGGLLIFLPPLAGMDGFEGGFALQFLGLFLSVSGLVTAAIFAYRVRRLESMFRGQELLAHWIYDPWQKEEQALRDLAATRGRNRLLLLIVAAFVVACTVLFVVIGFLEGEEENMPGFVGIMLAVLAVVAIFALGMPYLQYRRALKSAGEALIASNGLYLNGVLHTWDAPLAHMEGVELVMDGKQARLIFNLRSLDRTGPGGYRSYCIEVPVPPGEEATAHRVDEHFRHREFPV
jgi:hypothetical protein